MSEDLVASVEDSGPVDSFRCGSLPVRLHKRSWCRPGASRSPFRLREVQQQVLYADAAVVRTAPVTVNPFRSTQPQR